MVATIPSRTCLNRVGCVRRSAGRGAGGRPGPPVLSEDASSVALVPETPNERLQAVATAVGGTPEMPVALPLHVLHRVAVFLASPEDLQHAEAVVKHEDNQTLSGRVVLLTSVHVVLAVFTESTRAARFHEVPRDAYTVSVSVWGRRSLVGLQLVPDSSTGHNGDAFWEEDWKDGWPPSAPPTLTFDDGETLQLPLQPDSAGAGARLSQLLPSLLADLSRP